MAKIARILGGALAVNRLVFGFGYLVQPQRAGDSWIGPVARTPGTQVMVRSQAARDIALGAGALAALVGRRDGEARAWLAAHALADGVDTAATWAARKRLPRRNARLALAIAGASTLVAVAGAIGLRSP
jgi:hypothetical protein